MWTNTSYFCHPGIKNSSTFWAGSRKVIINLPVSVCLIRNCRYTKSLHHILPSVAIAFMVPVLLDLFPYFILLSLFSVNPLQSEYRNFFFFFRLEWLSFYSWNNFHSHFRCFKYRWIRMMTSRIYLLSRKENVNWLCD